tara:strand:- start:923 stop:1201 length:279 start_codon:yes stop_codon:yes gene_type:complete
MEITYDPSKNLTNIAQRGLSFDQVKDLDWTQVWMFEDGRKNYGEIRYIAYAPMNDRLYAFCFTRTELGLRVISFRKANKREVNGYEQRANDK